LKFSLYCQKDDKTVKAATTNDNRAYAFRRKNWGLVLRQHKEAKTCYMF